MVNSWERQIRSRKQPAVLVIGGKTFIANKNRTTLQERIRLPRVRVVPRHNAPRRRRNGPSPKRPSLNQIINEHILANEFARAMELYRRDVQNNRGGDGGHGKQLHTIRRVGGQLATGGH